mgnify:FL=1
MTTKISSAKCDRNFPQCKRQSTVAFPASAFTSELHLCWQHAKAFSAEAAAFHGRNA